MDLLHELTLSRERSAQLQHALESRIIIEQAKGMVAYAFDVSVDDAFDLLRSYSREHRVKLHEVCRDVIERRLDTKLLRLPG